MNEECPICNLIVENCLNNVITKCNHKYHLNCLITNLKYRSTCSICRTELDDEKPVNNINVDDDIVDTSNIVDTSDIVDTSHVLDFSAYPDNILKTWLNNINNMDSEIIIINDNIITSVPEDLFKILEIIFNVTRDKLFDSLSIILHFIKNRTYNNSVDNICVTLNDNERMSQLFNLFKLKVTHTPSLEMIDIIIEELNNINTIKLSLLSDIIFNDIRDLVNDGIIATLSDYFFDLKNWLYLDIFNDLGFILKNKCNDTEIEDFIDNYR